MFEDGGDQKRIFAGEERKGEKLLWEQSKIKQKNSSKNNFNEIKEII